MGSISEALAIAFQHHQGGRLQDAEQLYRQILAVEPNQADVWHLLGLIAHQVGQHAVAIEYIERAVGLQGNAAPFHNNLGEAYCALRRFPEAVACYHRAIELLPDYAEAYNNLGNALNGQGKSDEAVVSLRRALELKPDFAGAHYNFGNVMKERGNLDEAVHGYRRAIELRPDFTDAHINLGNAWDESGKVVEAIACYRRALELAPNYAEAYSNLGNALKKLGKLEEAIDNLRRAIELKPEYSGAYNNLGNALKEQGKLDEAVACYQRALELKPDCANSHSNLGNAVKDLGKSEEAIHYYRRALELKPDFIEAHSNLLYTLQYCTGATLSALAEAHIEYDRQHAEPLRNVTPKYEIVRHPHEQLRIGFVSPDFVQHPIGFFLVRVLENFLPEQHVTICYSDRILKDDYSCRLQAASTKWRDVIGLSDERLAAQIREDQIDILFDLAGHTASNRLLVFSRKPAPIQVTWAGYVGTTGLKAMDYLLADHYHVLPDFEKYYQERILYMPDGYICYDPPDYAPPVAPLPALEYEAVTFGCFNNPAKITPTVIDLWAKILCRLPTARLVFKYKGWNERGLNQRVADVFIAHAVDPGRLEFLGPSPHAKLLAEYNRIDLALDTFPYSGGLTTLEALWMGVPVITCPGETFASRHSFSHLSNIGLTETIAPNLDEYVELAVALANDLPRLAALRRGLRERMAVSPLCDGKRFADNLTNLLRGLWHR